VQTELAALPGCTVLIYDQTCAAEKRRRAKKRGNSPIRNKRVIINSCLRGLRRLRRESRMRVGAAAGDRMGPQADHRSDQLNKDFSCVKVLRHS